MNDYIPSNVNADEYFRYYCKDENAIRFYEESLTTVESSQNEMNSVYRENEELQEQIFNASETLNQIEALVKNSKTLKEFKKKFATIISNSYFER